MPSGTTIEIKEGTISISSSAFSGCSGLTSVTIPNSVTSIGSGAFDSCSGLTSVTIPNSVKSIGDLAFYGCSGLTSVTIGNSVTSIGNYAFSYCSGLTSVTIGNSVTSIGTEAFYYCDGLTSVTIGNSVTSIGSSAFGYCSGLKEVHISDIAAWCNIEFSSNPLYYAHHLYMNGEEVTDLIIPEGVTAIKKLAFNGCSGLTSVTIPNSVTSIGDYAFNRCSGLTSITSYIPAEKLFTPQTNVFEKVDKTGCILYVPKGAKEKYATTDGWKDFMNIVEIIETYKVTFVVDGEVFATDSVTEGNSLDFPNVPEKEGYTFLGWSEVPETMPANDITITGEWSINSYLVTYIVDGEVYATDSVEYGAEIVLPEVPEKENSTFEWEEAPTTMPASDVTIYGNYVSGIGGITASDKADVYTLNGMLYKRDVELNKLNIELPKGVYIINGKKFMVR